MATTQNVKDLQVGARVVITNNGDVIGGGIILEIVPQSNRVVVAQKQIIRYKGHVEENTFRSGHYLHGYVAAEMIAA